MKTELVIYHPTDTAYNRALLAKDVAGVKCIWTGPSIGDGPLVHNFIAIDECRKVLPPGHRMRGVELYANGRSNVYVVPNNADSAIGFIRVTPEPEEEMWYSNEEGCMTGGTPITHKDEVIHGILKQEANITMFTGYQTYEIECMLREAYQAGVKSWIK